MPQTRPIALATPALFAALAMFAGCGGGGASDAPTPPSPSTVNPVLAISDAAVVEGNSATRNLQFTVTATAAPSVGQAVANASVAFTTEPGSATAGVDYSAASGTLQFPAGTQVVTIDVEILADTELEVDETFIVRLSSPINASLGQASATGTIRDDDTPTASAGLDSRPDNQTCIAPDRPTANSSIALVDIYPLLPDFAQPTKLLLEPVSNGRWFVLQKSGEIITFSSSNPTASAEYLDLNNTRSIRTNSEGGLLGMAFHPDYPSTPEIFLSYTVQHTGPNMRHLLTRVVLDDVSAPGAGTTEQILLEIDQDFDNHNGGDIAFGDDGYLYFGLGDGGSSNDPRRRAQDTTRLLGSMLRIDVVGTGAGYAIPPDNPFAANALCGPAANANDCPEIYAWGLRNPWRWSFDRPTGELWLADVGQGAREEVDLIERGGNYGWRCREGSRDTANAADCASGGLIDPVTEYDRSLGTSITGGFVYRGDLLSDLVGLYIFADYGSGRFWAARADGQGGFFNDELIDSNLNPTAFALGPDDELYVVNIDGSNGLGRVRRVEPAGSPVADTIPERLSDTGCVNPTDATQVYAGVLPYDLNAPFWSDGAAKERYIGLPNGTTIDINANGDFEFPNGTVIVKNFRLNGNLIETRHLMRHPDGVWAGYTYEWNATQTDATRVRGGKRQSLSGQDWIYPSEAQCMECHTGAAGFALGPEIAQLNKDFTYPSTGRRANQLETLEQVMVLSAPLPGSPAMLDALIDPELASAALEPRARAYFHTNCAQCHRPNGPTPSTMDLRYSTLLRDTEACDALPSEGSLGIANARLLAPGSAATSLIINRMQRRDIHGMPPLGSTVIDTANVNRISTWVDSLNTCD